MWTSCGNAVPVPGSLDLCFFLGSPAKLESRHITGDLGRPETGGALSMSSERVRASGLNA